MNSATEEDGQSQNILVVLLPYSINGLIIVL